MRQHVAPILLTDEGAYSAIPLPFGSGQGQISEATLQQLIHDFPGCLPIREIDPVFIDPVPLCMELTTNAGPIDNLLVTPSGLPVIVECKLWRNPEGRREVVGQILDYAKELSRWTSADLQREVARRTGLADNPMLALLRSAGHEVDETDFNDALTNNLKRGRFLLLIVGDGIREGVEAIAEYLHVHANLHFSFALVEMPIFLLDDGRKIVSPRVLARTKLIERQVVALPDGFVLQDGDEVAAEADDLDPVSRINFWRAFVLNLKLDDPEQAPPKPTKQGSIYLPLPLPGGVAWFTVYRMEAQNAVGLYLSYTRDSLGARVVERLLEDWEEIRTELGGTVFIDHDSAGRNLILDRFVTGNWTKPEEREKAFDWLRRRTNDFVNVLRPRIKAIVADLGEQ